MKNPAAMDWVKGLRRNNIAPYMNIIRSRKPIVPSMRQLFLTFFLARRKRNPILSKAVAPWRS
jgi:hypothetical protein